MKPFVYRSMFVLSLLTFGFFSGQATTLGLGDLAITGYNADNPDEFSFVLLTDISGTTIISFTDAGWFAAGGFRPGEGTIRLTITGTQSCGTEFLVSFASGSWASNIGSVATAGGSFELSSSGDQIFAYSGTTAPTGANQTAFITGLHFAGAIYDLDATGSVESAQPSVFGSNPGNDFAVAHMDNGKYGCSLTSGLPADLRANIYTAGNWSFTNSSTQRFTLSSFCNFSCTAACSDPTITSLTTNSTIGSNTFCPGDPVVITVNGTANDATSWNLYSGSCGGTLVSTIPVSNNTFSFTATSTITLYVGGTGGCVATPTCTPITITVNGLTANAGSDQKISGSTTANLSGNGTGSWSIIGTGDGNGYFDGVPGTLTSNNPTATFTGTAGQQYELRWTVTNAGCANSSADVLITFLSQTTLGLGDIAFTGYNSDNPDEFRFVLLKDINAGTQITFTDNGWLGAQNGFRGGENTITYEFCRPYSCGDEFSATRNIAFKDEGGSDAATVVSGTSPALATSGDQIFAYQGTAPTSGGASNWIAAIQMNGAWDANAVDAATSAQPSAFTDGVNSISISPQADNAKYNCSITTNSPANLRAAVNTASNWTTQEAILSLDYCSFTCGSCVEPVLTSVSAPATACPGQTVALTINGTLNGANEWAIYTGSCGGTLVGTTTSSSFNVTPTATTTYYVSGRGGCVVTESCQTATISVTSVQADAGPDQKISGATSATLAGNGSQGDGTWTFVDNGDGLGNISDDTDPASSFSGTAGQSYTLKWTIDNPNPCSDTEDEVTIVFLSQTTLTTGDIAFIAYSADDDDLAFVILKDINAGTTINFTDRGWQAAGGFRSGEGTITVEFCRPYSCGDEFNIFDATQEIKDASGQLAGTITGVQLDPATSGDQIFAYQGTEPTVGNESNFLAAIQMNGAWDTNATTSENSAQPSAFTDGVNSISFTPEVQNAYIDCSKVTLATGNQINNSANWITSNSSSATLPLNCNLACCTPGVANSISGSSGLCPSSLQTLSVNGNLNDDQTWVWYTGSCGGTQVSTGPNFNVSPTVTTTYYVRAEGTCSGTSGACASFTIVVEDGVDPVVSCPADISVNSDPGQCSAVVNFSASGTDNCGGTVDFTYSQDPGTAFNVGTTTVNVTGKDFTGNTDNCSFDVTVNDNEDPVVTCLSALSVDLDTDGGYTFSVNFVLRDIVTSLTDNCSTSNNVNATRAILNCDDVGNLDIIFFFLDIHGNKTNCTVDVTVNDPNGACNQPPVANCKNITVSTAPNTCEASITPAQVDDNSTDPDGDPLQLSLDNSGPFATGTHTVELTVSDGSLSDKCTATVTVKDNQAPQITCPSNITVSNDAGSCDAEVSVPLPTVSDNCSSATTTALDFDGNDDVVNLGSANNMGTSDFTIECWFKADNVISTNANGGTYLVGRGITTVANPGGSGFGLRLNKEAGQNELSFIVGPGSIKAPTIINTGTWYHVAGVRDGNEIKLYLNGSLVNTVSTGSVLNVTTPNLPFGIGAIIRQPFGNNTTSFNGKIDEVRLWSKALSDNAISCNAKQILTGNENGLVAYYNMEDGSGSGTLTDQAGSADGTLQNMDVNTQWISGPSFPLGNYNLINDYTGICDASGTYSVGATMVKYTAEDAGGNKKDCSFTVTVNDTEDPVIACPGDITVNNDPGQCGAVVDYSVTFGDNCPGANLLVNPASGSFFGVGTGSVLATVTDVAGNTAQCGFNVTVKDNEDPVIACPGDITVNNDPGQCGAVVDYSVTFGDNCPGAILIVNPSSGSFFGVGTGSVLASVSDAAGNSAQCSFNVTVKDTEDPVIACPGDITVNNDPGECGAVVDYSVTFGDNCPGAILIVNPSSGSFFGVGTGSVLASVSDAAGNSAQCSFNVTVKDNEAPTFSNCPGNISVNNDPGDCGANVNWTPPNLEDNCPGATSDATHDSGDFFPVGTTTVTYSGSDAADNNATDCSFTITVNDTEAPMAVCKDLTIDFNGEQDINLTVSQVWDEAASSDNCGTVEFVSADLTIGCDELGNTVAIPVTIKDGAGNEDDCTAYVDVIGLPCGWAEGPNDGSLNCDGQTTSDYDVHDESFTLTSDGCWHDCREEDRATFVYHPLCGDGTLTAKLASINTSGYAGLMARESLDPWARRAGVLKNYSTRRVRREWRSTYGGIVSQSQSSRSRVKWLRVVRKGNEIKSYTSTNGSYWRLLYKVTFPNLEDCIYVGMTAYSLNGNAKVEATFEDVTFSGSGTVAGGVFNDDTNGGLDPTGLQAWGTVGNVDNGTIEVFPNPASDQAQIVLDGFEDKPAQLFVRDAFGKIVRQIDLDSALGVVMPLEVQDLAAGVYMISLVQEERLVISKRLVVQP